MCFGEHKSLLSKTFQNFRIIIYNNTFLKILKGCSKHRILNQANKKAPVIRGSVVSYVVMRKIIQDFSETDKTATGWESSQLYVSKPYSSRIRLCGEHEND